MLPHFNPIKSSKVSDPEKLTLRTSLTAFLRKKLNHLPNAVYPEMRLLTLNVRPFHDVEVVK